jgi:hypothetical protein
LEPQEATLKIAERLQGLLFFSRSVEISAFFSIGCAVKLVLHDGVKSAGGKAILAFAKRRFGTPLLHRMVSMSLPGARAALTGCVWIPSGLQVQVRAGAVTDKAAKSGSALRSSRSHGA